MAVTKIDYPAVLTKAAWDKNKGTAAKLFVGKTDVGASLAAVEALFKEKGFATVAPFAGLDPIEAQAHANGVFKQLTEGAPLVARALVTVRQKAGEANVAFAKSKTVSTASKTFLKNLIDAIGPFTTQVKAYPAIAQASLMQTYREDRGKDPKYRLIMDTTKLGEVIQAVKELIEEVKSNPTVSNLSSKASHAGKGKVPRNITTVISNWRKIIVPALPTLARTLYAGDPEVDTQPLTALWQLANESGQVASNYLNEQIKEGRDEADAVRTLCDQFLNELKDRRLMRFLEAMTALKTELEK